MNDWTPSQIKEIVGDKIADERRYRDAERASESARVDASILALRDSFKDYAKDAEKALKLQAADTERRLEAYPTTKDFNTLKSRVDIELESRASSSKGVVMTFQLLSALAIVISVGVAILSYAKGLPATIPH